MEEVIERLEAVLKSELETHSSLLASAQEFNGALREENVAKIDRQRTAHDDMICRIEKLEEQRSECCSTLARSLGIGGKPLRMSMLLEKLPPRWRERLSSVQRSLREKVNELSKINLANRILLEEGLRMAEHTFSMVRQAGPKYTAYGTRGQSVSGPAVRTIVNRTI